MIWHLLKNSNNSNKNDINTSVDCLPSIDPPDNVFDTDVLAIAPRKVDEVVNDLKNVCDDMNKNILTSYTSTHELLKSQFQCIEKLFYVSSKVLDKDVILPDLNVQFAGASYFTNIPSVNVSNARELVRYFHHMKWIQMMWIW